MPYNFIPKAHFLQKFSQTFLTDGNLTYVVHQELTVWRSIKEISKHIGKEIRSVLVRGGIGLGGGGIGKKKKSFTS